MRKRIIGSPISTDAKTNSHWLPLEQIALVEVTSEDPGYPVENVFRLEAASGWRATQPGEQIIRLIFDTPQRIERIWLLFTEHETERSQEFVLRWSPDGGQTFFEIVRQQWNFNPVNSAQEHEDYRVDLDGVTQLELKIVPDRSGGQTRASLDQLRLA